MFADHLFWRKIYRSELSDVIRWQYVAIKPTDRSRTLGEYKAPILPLWEPSVFPGLLASKCKGFTTQEETPQRQGHGTRKHCGPKLPILWQPWKRSEGNSSPYKVEKSKTTWMINTRLRQRVKMVFGHGRLCGNVTVVPRSAISVWN